MTAPILVTGAGGQVGSALVRLAAGRSLVGLSREELDLTDTAAICQALDHWQPTLVLNAAAYTAVDRAEQEPELAKLINHHAVAELGAACAARQIPVFHLSTDYVFDGSGAQPWQETDSPAPLGVYGVTKLAGERALQQVQAEHLILRVSWVFGQQGANFVRTILRLAAERPQLRVVADQWGAPTAAESIASTLLALADRWIADPKAFPWGLYHYTSAEVTTWHGFAEAIVQEGQVLGYLQHRPQVQPIDTAEFPTLARRPANSRLDCSLFRTSFGLELPDWQADLRCCLMAWGCGR